MGKKVYFRKCVICGKSFTVDGRHHRRLTCSEECKKKRLYMEKEHYYNTHPYISYRNTTHQYLKNKPDEELIDKLKKNIIKLDILDKLLKERGIDTKEILKIGGVR